MNFKDILKLTGKTVVFRLIFPFSYKYYSERKEINQKKAVFIEIRHSKITDSFQLIYERMRRENYEVSENFIDDLSPGKLSYIERCIQMLKNISDAHYVFLNEACNVTSCIPLRKGTEIIQVWHSCGAFKKFGMSTSELLFGADRKTIEKFPYYGNLKYVTVSSPEVIWAFEEAMNLRHEDGQVRATGISRTDVFFDPEFLQSASEKVCAVCNKIKTKKVILYAPTYRGNAADAKGADALDIRRMRTALQDKYVLLIKQHPFVKQLPRIPEDCRDFAVDVSGKLDIELLLVVSDICISDYSSLVFEYSLFERPIIFFAYDLENYNDWRGFYYDYDELTPGPVFRTTEEIVDYIQNTEISFDKKEIRAFREKFMSACDGHATDRIMDLIKKENQKY